MKNDFIVKEIIDTNWNPLEDQLGNIAVYAIQTFDWKEDWWTIYSQTVYPKNMPWAKEKAFDYCNSKAIDFLWIQSSQNISKEELNWQVMRMYTETAQEKSQDLKEAQEILLSGQYIVNISSKGKKKIATIFDAKTANADGVEFDAERWDINTESIDVAEKYKSIVESEGLNAAMERFKSL